MAEARRNGRLFRLADGGFTLMDDDRGQRVELKHGATLPGARREAADGGYDLGPQWVDRDGSLKAYVGAVQ